MTLTQLFTAIANAIRAKKGTSGTIIASNFPTEIANITTGHLDNTEYTEANDDLDDILENTTVPSGTLNITANGEYDITNYTEANVNVVSEYNANVKGIDDYNKFYLYQYIDKIQNGIEIEKASLAFLFYQFYSLITAPEMDTRDVVNMNNMFGYCSVLVNVPIYNISSATMLEAIFKGCTSLSNESLNNILYMCANATAYINQGTNMTLKYIGLTSAQATTCQGLSNYQAFLNAGWTTGY